MHSAESQSTFRRGAIVLVTLREPREKFWGAVLEITTAGVGISGISLNGFDDFIRQLRDGDPVSPSIVFFPIHRVERIELDLANGEIPSLRHRFLAQCGQPAETVLLAGDDAQ
ncbi:MAG: hypothetical protein ACRD3E_00040 [Terriglobales bacterium]